MTEASGSNSQAGWYPDPQAVGWLRYWDGAAWTDHRSPQQRVEPAGDADRWGQVVLWVSVAFMAFPLVALATFLAPEPDDWTSPLAWLYLIVGFAGFGLAIAAWICTSIWLSRARRNVEALRPEAPQKRSAIWVTLGWVIPIVSFWFPYQVVRDIGTTPATDTEPSRQPPLLGWWWGFFIPWSILFNANIQGDAEEFPVLYTISLVVTVAVVVTGLVSGILWVRIVQFIRADQRALLGERMP